MADQRVVALQVGDGLDARGMGRSAGDGDEREGAREQGEDRQADAPQ
ncbi:hypothetical protein G5V59_03980 [Nocardioides sp. W3-2-3]|nr:hypothetical protein [Nocardioides convexus]NGZ99781.1 hypothetical protein [Nocardioides convexus]